MSEKKYTHIEKVKTEVLEMLAQGKTQKEAAEYFGFRDRHVVKGFVKRYNRQQKKIAAGIKPQPKGRPRKDATPRDIEHEKDYEIRQLKMEIELLRDFLRAAGRR